MTVTTQDFREPGRLAALRLVLVISLGHVEASVLLADGEGGGAVSQWPSSVYCGLAEAMITEPRRWSITARYIDLQLERELRQFLSATPAELVASLSECRGGCSARELAALVWAVARRNDSALEPVLERLAAEVEVALFQQCSDTRTTSNSNGRVRQSSVRRSRQDCGWSSTEPGTYPAASLLGA